MPADLSLTLIDNADPIIRGNLLTYTLTVTNNGPDSAENVVVTDTLSPDVTMVSSSATTTADSEGILTTNLDNLAAGATTQFTLSVLVDSATSGPLSHTASVTAQTEDDNLSNNSVTEETTVVATAATNSTGGGTAINNVQPYGTLNYAIALQGTFPSRSLSADPLLGSVMQFAGNFAPRGWALANGQLLSIAQNTALFAILGTTYGGDGITTFALPDLRGRTPIGAGTGLGLAPVNLGQKLGTETVNLTTANLPSHSHTLPGLSNETGTTGSGQAFSNIQPSLGLNPVITVEGLFPSRNLSLDPYLGSIDWFAGNFAPRGTLFAHGQLLPISQFSALFSILGTTYGGDGITTFALPDLRGRTPIHQGTGSGLSPISLGETGGTNTTTLTTNNLPVHTHSIAGTPNATNPTGSSQPFNNQQPYLGVNYQISLNGLFPSRNLAAESDDLPLVDETGAIAGLIAQDAVLTEAAALEVIYELAQVGIDQWLAAGISEAQAAQLASVTYQIADLETGNLAFVGENNQVTIDADASYLGWFVDETPWENEEFGSTDPLTGELFATEASALNRFDLLTAIMHEQGHILGLSHTDEPGSILYGALGTGGRVLPTATDLDELAVASDLETLSPYLSASSQYIAGVGMFAGNFTVRSFAQTDGQLLSIAQNTALFSLLGTIYGGDGRTTFALPDLRGRTVLHAGQGLGLSNYPLGSEGGSVTTTLTTANLPAHSHSLPTADLAIALMDDTDPVVAGDTLTYTLMVTNNGPNTAENVVVANFLPAGVTLIETTGAGEDPSGVPSASLGNITSGGSAELTITVSVDVDTRGTIANQATVFSATTDFDTSNNTLTEETAVVAGFFAYSRFLRYQNLNADIPTDTVDSLPLVRLFDETFYQRQNPDVAAAIQNGSLNSGYEHFTRFGRLEGRNPSVLYDEAFYLANNQDVAQAIADGIVASGLQHFLQFGHRENRDPSSLFDQADYLTNNPDVAAVVSSQALGSAFEHYIKFGADEDRSPSLALYNESYYLANNSDVANAIALGTLTDGFTHFVSFGQSEQRSPSALFNQADYLAANADVNAAVTAGTFASTFEHYEQFGRFETRPLG